ncbi:lipoprotein [Pseudomonas fragi]|nr:lipoprotein [Pseudomonas fragi]
MMHVRHFTPHCLRVLFVSAMALVVSGCSMAQTESFTFQADMPENFTVSPMAYYDSASGEACSRHNLIQNEQPKGVRPVEFKLPLTDTAKGCSMVLTKVVLHIEGQWGKRELDMSLQTAGLSIHDEPSESVRPFPESGPLVFQGQCQWLFRTVGSKRFIRKILQCRALDANGVVQKSLAGGALQRDQLAGKTVKLVLTEAKEEKPAVGDNWVKFPAGWKRCMGKGLDDAYGFCRGNTTDFKPFKMPDGRDCTVYPNCTE